MSLKADTWLKTYGKCARQNEEATWLFRCVTEAGYLAANVDFKRQNPDWNCHYCGFSNGGILDRCRICNAKSLHAQARQHTPVPNLVLNCGELLAG